MSNVLYDAYLDKRALYIELDLDFPHFLFIGLHAHDMEGAVTSQPLKCLDGLSQAGFACQGPELTLDLGVGESPRLFQCSLFLNLFG